MLHHPPRGPAITQIDGDTGVNLRHRRLDLGMCDMGGGESETICLNLSGTTANVEYIRLVKLVCMLMYHKVCKGLNHLDHELSVDSPTVHHTYRQ